MKKILLIEGCYECYKLDSRISREDYIVHTCIETQRSISNIDDIPSWCPLPDPVKQDRNGGLKWN
uniref:Uncharacterized protein n=1 Tax=viral metagenome TaxID=1070528 RepID=A0A6M3LLD2_9ZZZZ